MPELPELNASPGTGRHVRIVFFANTDWYLHHFRMPLMCRARQHFQAEVWIACPDGPYRALLEAGGFRWIPVEMRRRSLNPFYDLVVAWRLSGAFRGIRPDLLHAFTLKSIFIGNVAAWLAGVPRVVNAITGLGSLYSGQKPGYALARGLLGRFFRIFFSRQQSRTIFQNPEDLRQIEALVNQRKTFRLIFGSGVDTVRFHPFKGSRPPLVMMASRLIRDKGIEILCEAGRLVHAEMPEVQFWIAGDIDPGNPTSYTREEIADLGREYPMVQFLGHRADMADLLGQAMLATLPAQAREGLPRTLIEACASGLALVASDVEGIRDVVFPGRNGLLVPPGDASRLAAALLTLLQDPILCEAMGRESRALALERFDQEKVLKATLAVYSELGLIQVPEGMP